MMNKVLAAVRRLTKFAAVLAVLICVFTAARNSAAQNVEHTKHKVDQTLRSNARINPSTLAVEMSIPIADLPGRGGASMPLVFNYSSKVWELRASGNNYGQNGAQAEVWPTYSSGAMAGWTSSYGIPRIDSIPELHDCSGNSTTDLAALPPGCGEYYYVKKMRVTLPGGSTHELRKTDGLYTTTTGVPDKTGTYLAVDGSRARLEWDAGGASTLFLPDGGRYFFDSGGNCYKYVDRHGNKLAYNPQAAAWTDTLGRTLAAPIPFTQQQIDNRTEGTVSFDVPGIGVLPRSYQLVWKKLSSGALADGYSLYYDSTSQCHTGAPQRGPSLFDNTLAIRVCSTLAGYFDPVVLSEVILPNGQKYVFEYTNYGEIARIDYPTGAYERFVYDEVRAISWNYQQNSFAAQSYGQSNRGVVDRYAGAGDGAAEQRWQYGVSYVATVHHQYTYLVTTTAPDNTISKRFLHRSRHPPLGSEYGTYGFDTAMAGMEMETQSLDSNGAVRSRKLFEWEATHGTSPATNALPERDARVKREISVIFEPGEAKALAAMTETVYDTEGSTDAEYFSSLNAKQTKTYHYIAVDAEIAKTASLATAAGWFSGANPVAISETDYLYHPDYKARNITGLVTETRIKDAGGIVKARSQVFYDEAAYLVSEYGRPTLAGWEDPGMSTKRGLVTTTKSWDSSANNGAGNWIVNHAQHDQFGNTRKTWSPVYEGQPAGNVTEIVYEDNYSDQQNRNSFALPTSTISPVPGGNGSATAFVTSVKYDFNTGLPVSAIDANNLETRMEYADPLLRPTRTENYHLGQNVGAETITEYGAGTSQATRFVKVKSQIDETKWKEGYSWFDGLGRTYKSQSVDSSGDVFTETLFDTIGRPWKTSNPYRTGDTIHWTENVYDTAGRLYKVKSPDNSEVETFFGLATTGSQIGTVVTVNDQAEKQRRSITNALGQLTRVDEPDISNPTGSLGSISSPNQPTLYSYDTLNNLTTVLQNGDNSDECGGAANCSQTRTFVYDSLSRLKQATNPESGLIQYVY